MSATLEALYPAGAKPLEAPVRQVTLLEDRAQVRRVGKVSVLAGQQLVLVPLVAPVLQDLSLRVTATASGKVSVVDARVRRALRVTPVEQPQPARALEEAIVQLDEQLLATQEALALCEQRRSRLDEVLDRGFEELPQDIAWGLVQADWKGTLEQLFQRQRALRQEAFTHRHAAQALEEERGRLAAQRSAFDRPDTRFVAWLEADVLASAAFEVELTFEYTVPNALWRPVHRARLVGEVLEFESRATVWQNTGEDWTDARLIFSTARASLGTEPPLLSDDLLAAQKKSDKVVVAARQVTIQKAQEKGGGGEPAPLPSTVDLPGVDDGGALRTLEAAGPCTVPSDGRPNVVPLFGFEGKPTTQRVVFPELSLRAFLKATVKNGARAPILAGPVELVLESGFVGWTQVLFVAPGEAFALSFGPDAGVRVNRTDKQRNVESHLDKWKSTSTTVTVYLSNLAGEAKTLEVTERMPVSEVEQVKVALDAKRTTPEPKVDSNGFASWTVELPPNAQRTLSFTYAVSTAPGVQGL